MKAAEKATRNFFGDFDMFAASPTLRANQGPAISSFCTGLFSFILTALFFYIFVDGMIKIGNYKKIESVQTEGALGGQQAAAEDLLFAIGIDTLLYEQIEEFFQVKLYVSENGNSIEHDLQQCNSEQWTILGTQYRQSFIAGGLSNFLCPVSTEGLDLNRTWLKQPKTVRIQLMPCLVGPSNPKCVPLAEHDAKMNALMADYGYLEFYLYFLDQALAPESIDPISYYLNLDNSFSFTPKSGVGINAYLGTYEVETDISLMPWQDKRQQSGTFVRQIKVGNFQRTVGTYEIYIRATFLMSPNFIKLERKVGKIDDTLSYAGGLFGIIISVLAFLLMSFNEYKYQLMVAERMFNYDSEGTKIRQYQLQFFTYVIYCIFDWADALFCVELKWPYFQKIHRTRDQVCKQIDVTHLFRKIQNMDISILHVMSQEQKDCLALTKTQSIQQLKRERLIADYYEAVIEGKPTMTLNDAENIKDAFNYADMLAEHHKKKPSWKKEGGSAQEMINYDRVPNQSFDVIFEKACKKFPQVTKEAEDVVLDEQLLQIEQLLRKSFSSLNERQKKLKMELDSQDSSDDIRVSSGAINK